MGADGTEEDDEPDNPRAWCDLAVISLNTGRPEAALRAATAAVDLDPLNEWGQRLVSLALTRLGRGADAVAPAREAVRLAPGSWPARLRLASVLRHQPGQWEEALAHAVLAARFAPEEPDPRVLLADLALVRGEHREAVEGYLAALALASGDVGGSGRAGPQGFPGRPDLPGPQGPPGLPATPDPRPGARKGAARGEGRGAGPGGTARGGPSARGPARGEGRGAGSGGSARGEGRGAGSNGPVRGEGRGEAVGGAGRRAWPSDDPPGVQWPGVPAQRPAPGDYEPLDPRPPDPRLPDPRPPDPRQPDPRPPQDVAERSESSGIPRQPGGAPAGPVGVPPGGPRGGPGASGVPPALSGGPPGPPGGGGRGWGGWRGIRSRRGAPDRQPPTPGHAQARINLGLALLRWERSRAHHDPAWPVDPRLTGRTRRALEVWSRQVRLLLAVTTLAVAVAALGFDRGGQARLAGVAVLVALVPVTIRQVRRVAVWPYVPAMVARDPWLGTSVASAVLSVAAFAAWLVLPVAGLDPVLDPLWAGLAGIVVLGWPALAVVRLLAETWRGRAGRALEQFALVPQERMARRNAVVTRWILVGRAWSAQLALTAGAVTVDPRAAVVALAVPYVLIRTVRKGDGAQGDRWLTVAYGLLVVAGAGCAAGGLTGWVWGWRIGLGAKAAVVLVFVVRAARAWWRGAPGPWRPSLLMCEDRLDGEARASVTLGPQVRQAFAYARGVVLAYGEPQGPRVVGVTGSISALGELRLIAGQEVWEAVERDPRVAVFAADVLRRRYWVEVRGVAVAEGDMLRVTPKQVLVSEFPGRHQRR